MQRFVRNTIVAAVIFLVFAAMKWITIHSPWDPFGDSILNQFASAALVGIVYTFGVTIFLLILLVSVVPFVLAAKKADSTWGTLSGCVGYVVMYLVLAGPAGFLAVQTFLKGWVTVNAGLFQMMMMVLILGLFRDNKNDTDSSKKQVRYSSRGGEIIVSGSLTNIVMGISALFTWWNKRGMRKRKNEDIDVYALGYEKPKRNIRLGDDGELIEY